MTGLQGEGEMKSPRRPVAFSPCLFFWNFQAEKSESETSAEVGQTVQFALITLKTQVVAQSGETSERL